MDRPPFFTIGHSTHPLASFVEMLQGAGIRRLVDVRSFRRSRTNPQFNQDTLPGQLAAHDIAYSALLGLGGRRGRQPGIGPDVNGYWEHAGFHNYADYALQAAFQTTFAELRELGQRERCAIMCAEAVWWRCHRRIIADYLLVAGEQVLHILPGRIEPARLTAGALVDATGRITYPAPAADTSGGGCAFSPARCPNASG